MPEPKDVHIDSTLSQMSVQYKNEEYIWPQVFPRLPVKKRSDKYFVYDKDQQFRLPSDALSAKAMPNQVEMKLSNDNYSVKDRGLSDYVSAEEEANADSPLRPRADSAEFLTDQLHLAQEKRVADVAFAAATYPTANKIQLSGTGRWGQSADDPINDILTGLDTAFMRPNTIVMGAEVFSVFRSLPEVIDAVKASVGAQPRGGIASLPEIAQLFDVQRVLVGRARYNTAKEGQTGAYSRIWGKHCALLYINPNQGAKTITFGRTFSETDFSVYTAFDGKVGVKGATFIKNTWNGDEKVIASDVGYFIQDAVA